MDYLLTNTASVNCPGTGQQFSPAFFYCRCIPSWGPVGLACPFLPCYCLCNYLLLCNYCLWACLLSIGAHTHSPLLVLPAILSSSVRCTQSSGWEAPLFLYKWHPNQAGQPSTPLLLSYASSSPLHPHHTLSTQLTPSFRPPSEAQTRPPFPAGR